MKSGKKKDSNNSVGHGGNFIITNKNSHYSNGSATKTSVTAEPSNEKISFSFAPSFVPTKSIASMSVSLDDAVGDDSGDESRFVTSTRVAPTSTAINQYVNTPPHAKWRRAKTVTGEWARRLIALRNSRSNDSLRLQNKSFARQRIFDWNDPRKRAKTYTDVTIMGQYNGPWVNLPEDTKITVLGYIHRHVQRSSNSFNGHNRHAHDHRHAQQQQQQYQEHETIISEDFFAWLTFTLATARNINLQRACKLRIYNAVILPCRFPVTLDLPPKSFCNLRKKSNSSGSKNIFCENIVICTHLCERADNSPGFYF